MINEKNALGEYLVERLRAILPDYEVAYRLMKRHATNEFFSDGLQLEMRIRRYNQDQWLEDFHEDKHMATRAQCSALNFHIDISPRDLKLDSDPERAVSFRRHLLGTCLKAWFNHRLEERGLQDKP